MERKIVMLLAVCLCMMAMALGGSADEVLMINPYYYEAQPPARNELRSAYASRIRGAVEWLTEPSLEKETEWKVVVNGAQGSCTYYFYVLDSNWYTNSYSGARSEPTFSYRFIVPGDYSLYVEVVDSVGNVWDYVEDFTIEADGVHLTMEEIVENLAAQCLAAGCKTDFEKAVWMHDWLVMNASYDLTYSYYAPEDVLVRGTGVCDSYRRAYEQLMNAVGVETVSAIGGNHAWNQVKMNGHWYNVDVTWDDPISGYDEQQPTVSGMEGHLYFGLPYEIMSVDHTFEINPKSCTEYEMNYFLHTGKVSIWTDELVDAISDAMEDGMFSTQIDLPLYYIMENGYFSCGDEHIVYNLAAKELNRHTWEVGDKNLKIQTAYTQNARSLPVEVILDPYTLILPQGLTRVEEEAFLGDTGFLAVQIPDGAALGDRCFSGCANLWKVEIPDGVTSISDTAFQGCSSVTIVCSQDSYAHRYAERYGLRVMLR